MLRVTELFVAIGMLLIAGALGSASVLALGLPRTEGAVVALAEKAGPSAARAMTMEIGKRLLWSSAKDRHGEVAVQRVDRFFELARQAAPGPAGAAKKKRTVEKTPVKAAAKKAVPAKGAGKKASKVSAKKKTVAAERKTAPGKGKVHPLVKIAGKAIAKGIGKTVVKKALAKAVKKSAKRSRCWKNAK